MSLMNKITAETAGGTVAFEAPAGKKLVLAIEDSGIDILHRCGGNAPLHDMPRRGVGRRSW